MKRTTPSSRSGGALVCDLRVGDTRPYYDLASLTKIVFTQSSPPLFWKQKELNAM